MIALIKRNPVLSYYLLTFLLSWGGTILLAAPHGIPTTNALFNKHWPIVLIPFLLGPAVSSLLLTGLLRGRDGLRDLGSRLLNWRAGPGWYAIALLTAPLTVILILLPLSLISPVFVPDILTTANKVGLILLGVMVGLIFGGLIEELGWTGFAVPAMLTRYGVFTTGLIVGVLHAIWHFLPTLWGSGDAAGVLSLSLLLPPCLFYIGVLPAYRVLMVWVYDRCGSLPVVMLMHASLTANTLFILAPAARGVDLAIYYLLLTLVMWGLVALALRATKRRVSCGSSGSARS